MSGDQFGWGVNVGRPCLCCLGCNYIIKFLPLLEIGSYTGNLDRFGLYEINLYISDYETIIGPGTNYEYVNIYCPYNFKFPQFVNSTYEKYTSRCQTDNNDIVYDFCDCREESPYINNFKLNINNVNQIEDDLFYLYRNSQKYKTYNKKCNYHRSYEWIQINPDEIIMLDHDGKSLVKYQIYKDSSSGVAKFGGWVDNCYYLTNVSKITSDGEIETPINERKLFAVQKFLSFCSLLKPEKIKADITLCQSEGYARYGNSILNYNPCQNPLDFDDFYPHFLKILFTEREGFEFDLSNIINIEQFSNEDTFIYPMIIDVKKDFSLSSPSILSGNVTYEISSEILSSSSDGNIDISQYLEAVDSIINMYDGIYSGEDSVSKFCDYSEWSNSVSKWIESKEVIIPGPSVEGWRKFVNGFYLPVTPKSWKFKPTPNLFLSGSAGKILSSYIAKNPDIYISQSQNKPINWPFIGSGCEFDDNCYELLSSVNGDRNFYKFLNGSSSLNYLPKDALRIIPNLQITDIISELVIWPYTFSESYDIDICNRVIHTAEYSSIIVIQFTCGCLPGTETWKSPTGQFIDPFGYVSKSFTIKVKTTVT